MIGVLAPRIARCLLELALAVIVFGLALFVAALWIAFLPYRRLRGPSRQRVLIDLGQNVLVALAAFVAAARAPAAPK